MNEITQPTKEQVQKLLKKIPLVEAFGPTVQGEGAVIGQQTYFLRFGLCDYKCKMCDSMHAVDANQVAANAAWLTQEEIFNTLTGGWQPSTTRWVTLSGGNPCIHDLSHLVHLLSEDLWLIAVETQGTFHPNWLRGCDIVTCSPKGPGMGERLDLNELDEFMNDMKSHPGLNMKIVIFDERDLELAKMLYERYVIAHAYLSPSQFYLSQGNPYPPGSLKKFEVPSSHREDLVAGYCEMLPRIMGDRVLSNVKYLPQLHVWLWGNKQGV